MKYERIKELLPKEFSNQKNAMFVEKAMRDTRLIREHARFVIVLDSNHEGEVFVVETIDNPKHNYVANVIAVLAPVKLFNGLFTLEQAIVLEIGVSRGRPYSRSKKKETSGIIKIKGRRKLREANTDELVALWPALISFITGHTRNVRGGWENQGKWFVAGPGREYERGAYFTVNESDSVLARKILLENTRYLVESHLRRKALHISWWLRRFKYSYYPEDQLKSFEGIKKAIDMWRNANWNPVLARAVVSNIGFGKKELFRAALKAHGLKDPFDDDPSYPDSIENEAKKLPLLKAARFYIPPRKREVQAKGCLVFECLLKESHP